VGKLLPIQLSHVANSQNNNLQHVITTILTEDPNIYF